MNAFNYAMETNRTAAIELFVAALRHAQTGRNFEQLQAALHEIADFDYDHIITPNEMYCRVARAFGPEPTE